jgi:hypothetical protein
MLSSSRNRHLDATIGVQKVSDFLSPEPLHADADFLCAAACQQCNRTSTTTTREPVTLMIERGDNATGGILLVAGFVGPQRLSADVLRSLRLYCGRRSIEGCKPVSVKLTRSQWSMGVWISQTRD